MLADFSARLDGTTEKVRSKLLGHQHATIEDWLELGDNFALRKDGKKRVMPFFLYNIIGA